MKPTNSENALESTKITSVIKAIRIMELFNSANKELSLAQISKMLGWPKSTLLNFLRTLESEGYLRRSPSSQNYLLGIKLMELGYNVRANLSIIHYAIPCMEDLCEQTKGNIYLTTHVDGSVLYLEGIYNNRRSTKHSIAGKKLPMHITASGKAMLSYLPDAEVDAILRQHPLVPSTKNSITDKDALLQCIKTAHELGYAVDNEEETLGIRCLSMAICSSSGYPFGALSISGPTMLITEDRYASLVSLLTEACASLSSYTSMFPCCPILTSNTVSLDSNSSSPRE